jgi:hypothetical protein
MENGYDSDTKQNKYIDQLVDKFKFFRLRSPSVYFEIYKQDFKDETTLHIENYIQDCKTSQEIYLKLNGIFTEVIARISKQAEPRILSLRINEDIVWIRNSLNEIRELVSFKWKLV